MVNSPIYWWFGGYHSFWKHPFLVRLHADRNPHNDKNAYGITFYCGFFTCVNGFSELRLNNNLTGGWCICIRIWVVLNVVGRVDGIMMASGLIEIHKISWESKGTPQCQVFPPRNSRPYHCPLFRPYFLERTWYWGRPPLRLPWWYSLHFEEGCDRCQRRTHMTRMM